MEETVPIKRPKLLLADDSITIRKVVELTFAEEGVDVFAVGDGVAAMQKFIEVQPDIVLVDVNMPDPDGYHICEMIKQDESTKDIPVLLLVGSFEPFDQTEAERVGADGFLTKPFQSVRELVGKVSELLGGENGFAPPADTADIETLYIDSVSETYRAPDGTADTFLGDTGMDDDLIEASYMEGAAEPEPVMAVADASLDETMQGYDWSAEPTAESADEPADEPTPVNGGFESEWPGDVEQADVALDSPIQYERVDDFEDTLETEEAAETQVDSFEVAEPIDAPSDPYEPSEEFINLITRRVVEKLSDKVIREIAREAVPRIAEKLIREALDQEGKKQNS